MYGSERIMYTSGWLTRARSADDDPPVEGTLRAHEREEVLGEVRRHFIVLQQLGRTIAVQATEKEGELTFTFHR